jgi:hypothetical protein
LALVQKGNTAGLDMSNAMHLHIFGDTGTDASFTQMVGRILRMGQVNATTVSVYVDANGFYEYMYFLNLHQLPTLPVPHISRFLAARTVACSSGGGQQQQQYECIQSMVAELNSFAAANIQDGGSNVEFRIITPPSTVGGSIHQIHRVETCKTPSSASAEVGARFHVDMRTGWVTPADCTNVVIANIYYAESWNLQIGSFFTHTSMLQYAGQCHQSQPIAMMVSADSIESHRQQFQSRIQTPRPQEQRRRTYQQRWR